MNKLPIPEKFTLFGQEFDVKQIADLVSKHDVWGYARCRENLVEVQKLVPGVKPVQVEQAFFHELTHCILTAMGRDDLSQDEAFVETFSQLLHQALSTSVFSKKK